MPSFEQFLMTPLSARSILVNLSLKKKASNRPKTIGVFTRTKTSRSDERLPIGYSLPDFQLHRSNFLAAPALTRKEGGRHLGGAPPPQTPPGEIVPIEFFTQKKPRGRSLIVTKQQKPKQFFTSSRKIVEEGGGQFIKTCLGTQATLWTASSINRKPIKRWTKGLFLKDIV